jgi:hypothetical protein
MHRQDRTRGILTSNAIPERTFVTNASEVLCQDSGMETQGTWCIIDPRTPGVVASYSSLLEARSWLQATQGPDTELTIIFVPSGHES